MRSVRHSVSRRKGYPFLAVLGERAVVIYSTNKEDINVARFRLPA